VLTIRVPAGTSTVCLHALNSGPGQETRIGCASFGVSLSPIGRLDSVTVQGNRALVTGWTFDFSDTGRATGFVIDDNGKHVAWGPTPVARTDVNSTWSITGTHGFSNSIALSPGANRICAYGVNTGTGGGNSLLGCRTVSPASGAAVVPAQPASPSPSSPVPASSAPVSAAPATTSPAAAGSAPASTAPAAHTATGSATASPSPTK
jgi:hypothetical protein